MPISNTDSNSLSLVSLNIQCLRTKINQLSNFIDTKLPDILCICEHWLSKDEVGYYSNIESMTLASSWSRDRHIHGGVAIYVNSTNNVIEPRAIDLNNYCIEMDIEVTGIILDKLNWIVVAIYRSPAGSIEVLLRQLDLCLSHLTKLNKRILIAGDYNLLFNKNSNDVTEFINLIQTYGLFLVNDQPTRGENCLDTIVTDLHPSEYEVTIEDPLISDHCAIFMKISSPLVSNASTSPIWYNSYSFYKRHIDENCFDTLNIHLSNVDWPRLICDSETSSQAFEMVFSTFRKVFDGVCPLLTVKPPMHNCKNKPKTRNKISWYTAELADLKNRVKFFHDLYKTTDRQEVKMRLYDTYLNLKIFYRKAVNDAKRKANVNFILKSHNPNKAAWDVINSNRKSVSQMKNNSSPDTFNKFFVETVKDICNNMGAYTNNNPANNVPFNNNSSLTGWAPVSPEQIVNIVNGFSNSNSQDIYGINIQVMKKTIKCMSEPFARIINACLQDGSFPDSMKLSRTIPVFKKGDPDCLTNYRPISLIPMLAKIMESIIKNQLVQFFEDSSLFTDDQHGFRKNRSTTTAVLKLVDKITNYFDAREMVNLTLCDLSKAFDCISHDVLLKKMERYGIHGVALKTFQNYLEGRKQIVSIKGAISGDLGIDLGVPQGSILGPVLFLIFINDLGMDGKTLIFADDTTLITNAQDLNQLNIKAINILNEAKIWFVDNKLKINEDKTQQLICSLKILPSEQAPVKLLGFWLDGKLTWSKHISELKTRLSKTVFLLRKLKNLVTVDYLITAYFGLFHSIMSYGIILWGHASESKNILILQKKVIRIITSSEGLAQCRPLFKQLNIMTFYSQFIFNCLVQIKYNIADFTNRDQVHHYNTRRGADLDTPFCRLSKQRDCYPVLAIRLYNNLDEATRNLPPKEFTSRIKDQLKARPLYSINEFFTEDNSEWVS